MMASQTPIEDLTNEMSSLLSSDNTPDQAAQTVAASDAAAEDATAAPFFSATPFAYDIIPSRVKQHVPLEVATSSIPGAGRGLFGFKDVAAEDLLFAIPFPKLNIIIYGPTGLAGVCDNCMHSKAVVTGRGEIRTNPKHDFRLSACSKCKVVHYCSWECQAAAWKRHHKFECAQLVEAKIKYNDSTTDVLKSRNFRCVLRLLQLYANEKISADEWAEFISMKHHLATMDLDKFPVELAQHKTTCERLKDITKTKLNEFQIFELILATMNNELQIALPLLKTGQVSNVADTGLKAETVVGYCLEPFVALINHCCEANTSWVNEGPELRVRAMKDIAAGEEITISYVADCSDYQTRQTLLFRNFSFHCTCALCAKGPLGPTGALRERVLEALVPDRLLLLLNLRAQQVERAIADMRSAGFGYEVYPMRRLYQTLLQCYLTNGNETGALKIALLLYYIIEPVQNPATRLSERIATLHCIITLLKYHFSAEGPSLYCLELPLALQNLAQGDLFHLRAKLVADTVKCFGADSKIAVFEKDCFEKIAAVIREHGRGMGLEWEHVSLDDEEERESFVVTMTELLTWAGLPALTFEQLMA